MSLLTAHFLMAVSLLGGLLILRAGEYRVHLYQRRFLEYMRGSETGRNWMTAFYTIEGVSLGVMCIELIVLPKLELPMSQRIFGLALLLAGGGLRIWARRTVGRTWSLMLIYVPDIPRVKTGPYRYFRHPEYLSRYLELLGFSMYFGSYFGFGIYLAGTLMILPQVLILEHRQLRSLSREPED